MTINNGAFFTCEKCNETFPKGWSDEEALAEMEKNGLGNLNEDELGVLCEECYRDFQVWLTVQKPEKIMAMEKEINDLLLDGMILLAKKKLGEGND